MSSKEQVLHLLRQHKGEYVSGEEIAAVLSISRTAVWKAIKNLRLDGVPIQAVTKRGYCLLEDRDILSKEEICRNLKGALDEDLIHVTNSIDSTNRRLKEMAMEGAPHGTVMIASHQSGGMAHRNEPFDSPKGGLYLSLLIRPEYGTEIQPERIAVQQSECIRQVVMKELHLPIEVGNRKDLMYRDQKIGGILTESMMDFEGGEYQWFVTGVGIWLPLLPKETNPYSLNHLASELIKHLLNRSAVIDDCYDIR